MNEQSENALERILTEERYHYQTERLIQLFNWKKMLDAVYLFHQATLQCKSLPNPDEANLFCKDLIEKTKSQKEVADKFLVQLQSLFNDLAFSQNSSSLIQRARKAIEFFTRSIHNDLILPFDSYITTIKGAKRIKKYTEDLQQFEGSLWGKIDELQKSTFDSTLLADGIQHYTKDVKPFPNLSVKKTKGDSAKETFAYFMAGKSITEIATQRNLALSTIEGHLAEFVKKGELDIFQLLTLEQLEHIHQTQIDTKPATTKELRESLNNQFSYTLISLALDYFAKETV
jgi:uncharacterized protein YpbB